MRLGKMRDRSKNEGDWVQYLRNINIRWFSFALDDLQELRIGQDERENLSIADGDLFICEGGEPGRCAVWRGGSNRLVYQKALHRFRTFGAVLFRVFNSLRAFRDQAARGRNRALAQ
jgi:type I restriction enzyme, S subunit